MRQAAEIIKTNYGNIDFGVKDNKIFVYSEIEEKAKLNKLLVTSGVNVSRYAEEQSGFEDYFIERIGV